MADVVQTRVLSLCLSDETMTDSESMMTCWSQSRPDVDDDLRDILQLAEFIYNDSVSAVDNDLASLFDTDFDAGDRNSPLTYIEQ